MLFHQVVQATSIMSEDLKIQVVTRKTWGANIDTKLIEAMKHLSVDLNRPLYELLEEALEMYIDQQSKVLSKSLKKKKPKESATL